MKLKPTKHSGPSCSATLPTVRTTRELADALEEQAKAAGIPIAEALRQITTAYAKRPYSLKPKLKQGRTAGGIVIDADALATLKRQAAKAGVPITEAIRQILASYASNPFELEVPTKGAQWDDFTVEPQVSETVSQAAKKAGISVSEALRQIVQRHLG